jgi:hypothetical protein
MKNSNRSIICIFGDHPNLMYQIAGLLKYVDSCIQKARCSVQLQEKSGNFQVPRWVAILRLIQRLRYRNQRSLLGVCIQTAYVALS